MAYVRAARRLAEIEYIGADSRNKKKNNILADNNAHVVIMFV